MDNVLLPILVTAKQFNLDAELSFDAVRSKRADADVKPFTNEEAFDVLGALNELYRNDKGYLNSAFLWIGEPPAGAASAPSVFGPLAAESIDFCVVFVNVKPDFNTVAGIYAFAWHGGTLFTDCRTPPDAALSQMISFMQAAGLGVEEVTPLENTAADDMWRPTRAAAFAISQAKYLKPGRSAEAWRDLPPNGAFSVTKDGTPAPIEVVLAAEMRVPLLVHEDVDPDEEPVPQKSVEIQKPAVPVQTLPPTVLYYENTIPFNGKLRLYL